VLGNSHSKEGVMSVRENKPLVLVRVKGQIDLSAYWPSGATDADTTTVELIVGDRSIQYSTDGGRTFKPTRAFEGATVKKKLVVRDRKRVGDRVVTIRLQGIDAPELHYRPQGLPSADPKKNPSLSEARRALIRQYNHEYRQHFGETATVMAADFLHAYSKNGMVDCEVDTLVHQPNDVFDVYGRFVGDVYVGSGAKRACLNHWLADNGWAFPTFYDSMLISEIDRLLSGFQDAFTKKRGFSRFYEPKIGVLDLDLVYRRPGSVALGAFQPGGDKGPVLMPKCFRRLVTLTAKNAVDHTKVGFAASVAGDKFMILGDFRAKGRSAKKRKFTEAFSNGRQVIGPEGLVFAEKASTLIGPTGAKVTKW
jgi:endonuclease YncB( thermonuclease family)